MNVSWRWVDFIITTISKTWSPLWFVSITSAKYTMFGHDSPFIKGSPQTQTLSNSAPLDLRPLNVLSLSFFRELFQFLAFVSYNSGNSNGWGWMNKNSLDFALHSRLNINVTLLTVVAMKPWQNITSLKPTTCQRQNKIHNKEKSINRSEIRRTIKCDYFWRGVEFSADPVYSSDLGLFARHLQRSRTSLPSECGAFGNFHQIATLIKIKCSVPFHAEGDVHQAGGHLEAPL